MKDIKELVPEIKIETSIITIMPMSIGMKPYDQRVVFPSRIIGPMLLQTEKLRMAVEALAETTRRWETDRYIPVDMYQRNRKVIEKITSGKYEEIIR